MRQKWRWKLGSFQHAKFFGSFFVPDMRSNCEVMDVNFILKCFSHSLLCWWEWYILQQKVPGSNPRRAKHQLSSASLLSLLLHLTCGSNVWMTKTSQSSLIGPYTLNNMAKRNSMETETKFKRFGKDVLKRYSEILWAGVHFSPHIKWLILLYILKEVSYTNFT